MRSGPNVGKVSLSVGIFPGHRTEMKLYGRDIKIKVGTATEILDSGAMVTSCKIIY
jgi:hypothetical protein